MARAIHRGKTSTMPGYECPLSLTHLIQRAGQYHKESEMITLHSGAKSTRNSYAELESLAGPLASALANCGIRTGDTISTLMFNNFEHCLIFYTLALMGVCVAPLNRTERPKKLDYMVGLVQPKMVFVDSRFHPIFEELAISKDPSIKVVICNGSSPKQTSNIRTLSEFVSQNANSKTFQWPRLNEFTALGVAFTSGSTGGPKAVIISHRAAYIHLLMQSSPDALGLGSLDVIYPLPPFFHALGWLMPYTAFLTGANLILLNDVQPGPDLIKVFFDEGVTFFCGVPAVLSAMKLAVEKDTMKMDLLRRTLKTVATGGTSPSNELINFFSKQLSCDLLHAWGMTELSPLGTVARRIGSRSDIDKPNSQLDQNVQVCGFPVPTVQLRVVDPDDFSREQPWDGKTSGILLARGPHTTVSYAGNHGNDKFWTDPETGAIWLNTGDIAVRTERGQMAIVDRQKDVIKSGGEWISSKELENELYNIPSVAEVAVVGIFNDKYSERPIAVIALKPGQSLPSDQQIRKHFLDAGFRKFEIPDEFIVWDELPHLGSGKLSKIQVREKLAEIGYKMPLSMKPKQTSKL